MQHLEADPIPAPPVAVVTAAVVRTGPVGLSRHDVSLYVLHQANQRIIDAVAEKLGLAPDRFLNNVHKYGNTSAASIPLVLDEACSAGAIDRGDTLLMCGFGAGLTWGTSLLVW